jgi:hypothetical protein
MIKRGLILVTRLCHSGWGRAARVNTSVLIGFTVFLFACLVASASHAGSLTKAKIFYGGTCEGGTASRMNIALHLLVNIISTGIFDSSSFFMQVLNSPSRSEVDKAHSNGSYLGIGVPSVRNAFLVSRFKTVCWAVLLVSSVPLHLLFNSMIFQTDFNGSDYQLVVANTEFLNGAPYYVPGASLVPASAVSYDYDENFFDDEEYPAFNDSCYENPYSATQRNIANISKIGNSWGKISISDCYN